MVETINIDDIIIITKGMYLDRLYKISQKICKKYKLNCMYLQTGKNYSKETNIFIAKKNDEFEPTLNFEYNNYKKPDDYIIVKKHNMKNLFKNMDEFNEHFKNAEQNIEQEVIDYVNN